MEEENKGEKEKRQKFLKKKKKKKKKKSLVYINGRKLVAVKLCKMNNNCFKKIKEKIYIIDPKDKLKFCKF